MSVPISGVPPSVAECTLAQACATARGALRKALAETRQGDGDFWFASERRLQTIEQELAAMEQLFADLYGHAACAAALRPAGASNT